MGEDKAKEIIMNLNATIKKMEKANRINTVESECSIARPPRAKIYDLKKKRTELITKYQLNGNTN